MLKICRQLVESYKSYAVRSGVVNLQVECE